MSNHPRWGVHSEHDDITWFREIETCKVRGADGYQYHPLWMNPVDAEARGIKKGDVVAIFNERGTVLAGAYVTQRIMPGSRRHRPRGQVRPHRSGGHRPGRGHQHHSAAQYHLQERLWARGLRLPGRGGEGGPRGTQGQVPGRFRPGMSYHRRTVLGRIYRGGCLVGKVMVIDLAICNGCHNCQISCKDEHVGNDWSPIAKPQPDTGQFWNKVIGLERGTVPKVQVTYHHTICQHCEDAPCMEACNASTPSTAGKTASSSSTRIRCRGNQLCLEACPYENVIYFNDDLNIAQKCTFCAHLLDRGWTETRCSDACPTGAFTFGDEADPAIKEKIAGAELLKPELPTRPRVYYLNLPKKWIAGAVFDPQADECLEGATVTAQNRETGDTLTVTTDNYGDFWLKGLADGSYTLLIEKAGYLAKKLGPVDADGRRPERRRRGALEGLATT